MFILVLVFMLHQYVHEDGNEHRFGHRKGQGHEHGGHGYGHTHRDRHDAYHVPNELHPLL
jgi:hypothetical protein